MKTFLNFLFFLTFANVVLGIELCTDIKEGNVIVGSSHCSIRIGCNTASAFTHCDLVSKNKYCQDKSCNDTRLKFDRDEQNFICQFELKEPDESGMYSVDERKSSLSEKVEIADKSLNVGF